MREKKRRKFLQESALVLISRDYFFFLEKEKPNIFSLHPYSLSKFFSWSFMSVLYFNSREGGREGAEKARVWLARDKELKKEEKKLIIVIISETQTSLLNTYY